MDQELWTELLGSSQEMLLYTVCSSGRMQWVAGRHCGSTHQMAALFCSNDVMAAIFNVWRRIRNPTLTIDVYLFEGQSCQISSRSNLIRQSLRLLFLKRLAPTRRTRWAAIWDQFLVVLVVQRFGVGLLIKRSLVRYQVGQLSLPSLQGR